MTMAEKLTALRKAAGLSQEQLAEALGVSRQSVSKWERGEAMPDIDRVVAVSRFFAVTTDELLLADAAPVQCARAEHRPVQDRSAEPPAPAVPAGPLMEAVRQNIARDQLRLGWRFTAAAAALFLADCVVPFAMQAYDKWMWNRWNTNAADYQSVFPMPVLLALTFGCAVAAVWFLSRGFQTQRRLTTQTGEPTFTPDDAVAVDEVREEGPEAVPPQ